MADNKIASGDNGNFEINLAPNTPYIIDTSAITGTVNLVVHRYNNPAGGNGSPVYSKVASTVALKDNGAQITLPNASAPTVITVGTALALICATAATVSVYKA